MRRLRLPLAFALLSVAVSAEAADRRLDALDRALASLESPATAAAAPAGDTPSFSALLSDLEKADEARRRAFDAVARKRLPAKARQRLASARRAYDEGQGRLLALLRQIAGVEAAPQSRGPVRAAPAARPSDALLREARELLDRIQEASRREPLSSGELKVRAPELRAPSLAQAAPGTTSVAGVDEAPIGSVPKILKDAAASFDGPIAVYEWVRNNIRPEFYYGAMKGPVQGYLEGSANDADTAAILIGLLRAKGFPARFVRGTVELPAPTLASLVGTATPEQAVRVLERAGIPHEPVLGAGGISSVKLERVWVEAYVPYVNYRGAVLDAQGKAWVPLDAAFKRLQPPAGHDVARELGFDARTILDEYLQAPQATTPLEFARARVKQLLVDQAPGVAYGDVLNQHGVLAESLGALPASSPYAVVARAEVSYDLPALLGHKVRFVGEADGVAILDETFPIADLLGRRLTLSYVPFSEEDREVVASFGGLYWTPPYLVDVKPVLKSGGVAVAAGTLPVGLGVQYTFRMEFETPGGTQTVANTVLAGNMLAVGIGGRQVTGQETESDQAAEILSARAWSYLERWNGSDQELADLLRVVPVRPTVSACLIMSDMEVEYAGGDPLYPLGLEWKGIAIDADLRSSAPVGLETRETERNFVLLSGLEGSILENRIFEEDLRIESVSTAKALQLAASQGIAVLDVTQANVEDVLPTLPFDPLVKDEIRDAVSRGFLARVPASPVTHLAWTGVGYLLLDEATGEAAYQLQGGHSGGVTVPAVIEIPGEIVDTLLQQGEEPAPEGSEVVRIVKFDSTDFQVGTVDKTLAKAFRVLVTNEDGRPVPNAAVWFTVVGGGGLLLNPDGGALAAEIAVKSNERGEARALYVLGKKTDLIPRYTIEQDPETFPTQVGVNLVTARSGSAALEEPFTAIGFPDERCDGQFCYANVWLREWRQWWGWANLRVAGRFSIQTTDQHENPLSNWSHTFRYVPEPELGSGGGDWIPVRPAKTGPASWGHVLEPAKFEECRATDPDPNWGTCPGEATEITVKTHAFGGASAYAFLGDSPYSNYYYVVDGAIEKDIFRVLFSTGGRLCRPAPDCVNAWRYPFYPPVMAGSRLMFPNEAYLVGGQGTIGLWTDQLYEKERIDERTDSDGNVHYYAIGVNEWAREPMTDAEIKLTPDTEGTSVSPGMAAHVGGGVYQATMTMSQIPQRNRVNIAAKIYPYRIKYKDGEGSEVDPAYVDTANMKAVRVQDRDRPDPRDWPFGLWGVKADIYEINRQATMRSPVILLTENETTPYEVEFKHTIEPAEFAARLSPLDVRFELSRGEETVMAGHGNDPREPFRILKGLPLKAGNYTASLLLLQVSADATGTKPKDLVSEPKGVTAGVVRLRLDANNDTVIDARDDEKLEENPAAPFAFWDGNPSLEEVDRLQDFATVRIQMPFLLPEGQRLGLLLPGSNWVLKRKVEALNSCPGGSPSQGKAYLCDKATGESQLADLDKPGQPARRGSDQYEITPEMLRTGDTDFLFQCLPKADGSLGCPANRMILSHLVDILPSGDLPVTARRTEIRPLRGWMSVFSLRGGNPIPPGQPESVLDDLSPDHMVAGTIRPRPGWSAIPSDARHITLMVHGYRVSEPEAESSAIPTWFKRLYWAGHPVLGEQDAAHAVGITWPGDVPDRFGVALPYFPEDEFAALASGVPLGRFISGLRTGDRRVYILAHSLGNMAVNSALKYMSAAPSQAPVVYVMNDAALPAEAFDANYQLTPADQASGRLLEHATDLAYPDDREYVQELEAILRAVVPCEAVPPNPVYPCDHYFRWKSDNALLSASILPRPAYDQRWRHRSGWKGWFASNLSLPNVAVYNSYNTQDWVLRVDQGTGLPNLLRVHAWYACQLKLKPYAAVVLPDDGLDNLDTQFWTLLLGTSSQRVVEALEQRLWGDRASHGTEIRAWSELAFWYSARSAPAGAQPVAAIGASDRNIAMDDVGGGDPPTLTGTPSHSYLWVKKFHEVWLGYKRLKDAYAGDR